MTDEPKYARGRVEVDDWTPPETPEPEVEEDEPATSSGSTNGAGREGATGKTDKGGNGVHGGDGRLGVETADPERFELRVLGLAMFDDEGRALAQSLKREHFAGGRTRVLWAILHEWYRVNAAPMEPVVLEARLVEAGRSAIEALELVLVLQTAWADVGGQAPGPLLEELDRQAGRRKHKELVLQARIALTPPNLDADTALVLLERAREVSNDNAGDAASRVARPRYLSMPDAIVRSMAPLGARMTTGIATLDTATVGGIPLSSVVIFCGAPGAAKSGLAVYLVHRFERQGAICMYLAADEPARGILTRFGQLEGFEREQLSAGGDVGEQTRQSFASRVRDRSCNTIVIDPAYDDARTIEDAHAELVALAGDKPRVLVVDSLQRARCLAADTCNDPRAKVNAKLDLLREQANGGTLIILLSEMGRASYDIDAERNPLAAGKESGAVEYDADLQINLYSAKNLTGMIDAVVAKSRFSADKPRFRLRLDFARASFSEVAVEGGSDGAGAPTDRSAARAAAYQAKKEVETDALARQLADLVELLPRKGTMELRRIATAKLGWGISNFRRAEARLKAGLDGRRLVDASAKENVCEWVMAVDANGHDEVAS